MRGGAVGRLAVDVELVEVEAGGAHALAQREDAVALGAGVVVQADHGVDMRVLQAAGLHHVVRAAVRVLGGGGLLAGLEDQLDGAAELVAALAQDTRGAQQARDVDVMAAGVHDAGVSGREQRAGLLGDGQGVDVRAQADALALAQAALDGGHDAGVVHLLHGVAAEGSELLHDHRAGVHFLEAQLRVAVKLSAELDHFGIKGFQDFFVHGNSSPGID